MLNASELKILVDAVQSSEFITGMIFQKAYDMGKDFYSRNPLISLIRDKIVLQLQLITPGSVSMTVCRKCSISSLDEATACT